MPSTARAVFQSNIARVDDVLSFHTTVQNPAVGPPPGPDRSLVLGAIALTYASWEAFIEQIAVEVVSALSIQLGVADVPLSVRGSLERESSAWDLADDGWRFEWQRLIEKYAYGTGTSGFGLNTAGPEQVLALYQCVGLDPFEAVSWQNMSTQDVKDRLAELVSTRGHIVHNAAAPPGVGLQKAKTLRDFVDRVAEKVDSSVGNQAQALMGTSPW